VVWHKIPTTGSPPANTPSKPEDGDGSGKDKNMGKLAKEQGLTIATHLLGDAAESLFERAMPLLDDTIKSGRRTVPFNSNLILKHVPTKVASAMSKTVSSISKAAPVVSALLIVNDISNKGKVTWGHVGTATVTVVTAVVAAPVASVVGGAYLIGQGISYLVSDQSLEDNLNDLTDWMGWTDNGGTIYDEEDAKEDGWFD